MLKRKKQIIAKVMATTMLASTLATTFTSTVNAAEPRAIVSETSIAGGNRYKTAVEISKNYTSTSNHAIIVNSENGIVDALTATPYASLKKAPILITQSTTLNSDTKLELLRREIKTVDIVGGTKSVSDSVKSQIESLGITVNRIAGINKYETALKVAKEIDKISDISEIAVTSGEVLADAVSVAAPAAQNKMPIILVHPTKGLDSDTKKYIDGESISTSYVIGGTTSISDPIKNSLPGTKERLSGGAGTGRQETNAAVVKKFYTSSSYYNAYVAKSGQVNKADEIVDALAVGVLAASKQEPVILVGNSLVSAQKTLLEGKEIEKITKVGNGIPTASIDAIKNTQKAPEKDPEATISSIKLIDSKTIEISGSELNRIGKTDISITGNTVVSYTVTSDGKKATIVFTKVFSNGANTVKVKSNLGNETSHSFTFDSAISSVEAITKSIGTNGLQYLEFTVNGGQKRTVKELEEIGWDVQFKSNDSIFYVDSSTSSTVSTDGKLKTNVTSGSTPFKVGKTYSYEIVLTNGDKKVKSQLQAIKVEDATYQKFESFDLEISGGTNDEVKVVDNKLGLGDIVKVTNIKAVDNKGDIVSISEGDIALTSKNRSVVAIVNGQMETQTEGTATIEVKLGNITKDITVTVGAAREVKTVSLSQSTVNLTTNSTVKVQATIKDQYGAAVKGNNTVVTGSTIYQYVDNKATTTTAGTIGVIPASATDGTVDIEITATTTTGSVKPIYGKIDFKNGDTTLATLNLNVSNDRTISKVVLENTPGSDYTIDKYTEVVDDDTVDINVKTYNTTDKVDYLVTPTTTITTSSQVPTSTSSGIVLHINNDNANITVDDSNDKIITSANKVGTTVITPYYNAVKQNPITITVKDTKPKMTDISLNKIKTITSAGTLDIVKEIFDTTELTTTKRIVRGVTLKSEGNVVAREVEMTTDGTLFIKEHPSGNNTTVGTVKVVTDITSLPGTDLSKINIVSSDKNKYILIKVLDVDKKVIATREIDINVK